MDTKKIKQNTEKETTILLHKDVPSDWYERSVKENFLQFSWHKLRERKLRQYSQHITGKVLDIGCADGYFTNIIREITNASDIIGIDILISSINYAKKRYKREKKLTFSQGDATNINFSNDTFNAVYAIESLEHVFSPQKVLAEIYRVLKPKGTVIIVIPTENLLFKFIWFFWTRTRGKIWKDTHVHRFNPKDLPELVKQEKFIIEKYEYFILGMLLILKARKQ